MGLGSTALDITPSRVRVSLRPPSAWRVGAFLRVRVRVTARIRVRVRFGV